MSADVEREIPGGAGTPGTVHSPCNSVCRMDSDGLYCVGCFRTLNEIAGWAGFDDARRRQIWSELDRRRYDALTARPVGTGLGNRDEDNAG